MSAAFDTNESLTNFHHVWQETERPGHTCIEALTEVPLFLSSSNLFFKTLEVSLQSISQFPVGGAGSDEVVVPGPYHVYKARWLLLLLKYE